MMEDPELLSPEELQEAQAEAERILSEDPKQYDYLNDYRGGPRRMADEDLVAAAAELIACRLAVEEIRERLSQAHLMLVERCEELAQAGVPIAHIARHSGLGHRGSVYREIRRLPAMRAKASGRKV